MTLRAAVTDSSERTRQVSQTREALDTIDDTSLVNLTRLNVAAVRALKQEVAEIFPASNLPAFLLQGLIQLEDRTLKQDRVAADLRVLFRGSKQIGLYGTFLAAPALVLYGYQRLLALAGKDPESAFPDGPWQFYTQFGLREDAARHCIETVGFAQAAAGASELDAAVCWVYTAMRTLFAYDDLLANEWRERAALCVLNDMLVEAAIQRLGKQLPRRGPDRERMIAEEAARLRASYQFDRLVANWAAQRPYSGPRGEPLGDYAAYRRRSFHAYLEQALQRTPPDLRAAFEQRYAARRERDLPAYQRQLTLLMSLHAESYQDQRAPIPLHMARVALLAGGRYYLLDAVARDPQGQLLIFPADGMPDSPGVALALSRADDGSLRDRYDRPVEVDRRGRVRAGGDLLGRLRPPPVAVVKGQVEAILRQARADRPATPTDVPPTDLLLARAPRAHQQDLRALLGDDTRAELAALRYAPIVINWNPPEGALPLSELRRARRGCGDHALTLLRSERGIAFDLSHIFFDAIWGMSLAEIMTGFASALYPLVQSTRPIRTADVRPLTLAATPAFLGAARATLADIPIEASAETDAADLYAINQLRRRLMKIDLALTVNDLLILARCAHAASYAPGVPAQEALDAISRLEGGQRLADRIHEHIEQQRAINPALLIPMDASGADPRMRVFPATFRNPLPELLSRLDRCSTMVERLRRRHDVALRDEFERERMAFYVELQTFGALLQAFKQVTMRGESFTMAALRLMGHLPGVMQNLVDMIPQKIGILNEILKGREVFSNVGQVVTDSTLTRFASARDDGATKLLVWGLMSDASGRLHITLRDFRPHVGPLIHLGRMDLAQALAQDYLDSYAATVNYMVRSVQRVLAYK
ncbi:MAG: hypothetical protein ACJ8CR_27060 [Roseiflexaceae bacterium]